jgi:valyl-tRNA synthetase
LQTRLNNEGYIQKARPELIAAARAELEAAQQQEVIMRSRLQELG